MKNDFSQGIFLLQIFTEVRLLIMDTLLVIVWQSRLYRIAGCLVLFPREKAFGNQRSDKALIEYENKDICLRTC